MVPTPCRNSAVRDFTHIFMRVAITPHFNFFFFLARSRFHCTLLTFLLLQGLEWNNCFISLLAEGADPDCTDHVSRELDCCFSNLRVGELD